MVLSATELAIPYLRENNLFIIESTCPVGTTEKVAKLIFSKRPELEGKICISYCPEGYYLEISFMKLFTMIVLLEV